MDIAIVRTIRLDVGMDRRLLEVRILETEGLIIFPIMGGVIDERVVQILKIANKFKKPVATTLNKIGIIANPGDDPDAILATWEKIDKKNLDVPDNYQPAKTQSRD